MTEKTDLNGGVAPLPDNVEELNAASQRWMTELGVVVENLAYMLRKPTEVRPFVYELRVDLLPAQGGHGKMILKGFGEDQGLVSFIDGNGLLSLLRNAQAGLANGKLKWYPDGYVPGSYDKRLSRYLSGEFYNV